MQGKGQRSPSQARRDINLAERKLEIRVIDVVEEVLTISGYR